MCRPFHPTNPGTHPWDFPICPCPSLSTFHTLRPSVCQAPVLGTHPVRRNSRHEPDSHEVHRETIAGTRRQLTVLIREHLKLV